MCGICGKLSFDREPIDRNLIQRMSSVLAHRGPDAEGIWMDGTIGLGHRRLSVIDLSPSGHQPMSNEDGTIWIVYNGEIYNFIALKDALITKGHVFRSTCDTEVIIHLYEEHGPTCLHYLRGMFAFAIWDGRERQLFLARDRAGKKPLYYLSGTDAFMFASEIKAILQDESVAKKPDHVAIHHYLTYQDVPSPWTAFEGIRKVPPAHYMIVKDGMVELKRYWKLSYLPKFRMSEEEMAEEAVRKLREAVKVRLISDVPLGAFLSGGIDSSAVVALMAEEMDDPVRTFSIGFREDDYNELNYAKMVATQFGTRHTEFMVEPDVLDIIDKLVWHYNEPFADASAIPSYYVSRLARNQVTVVLNGDGGDEDFAGYERYTANAFAERMHGFLPASAAKALLAVVRVFPHKRSSMNLIWKIKRFLQEYPHVPLIRNAHWLSHFTPEMKSELYAAAFMEEVAANDSYALLREHYEEAVADHVLDRTLYADTMMYLPDDLLVKIDVASMANSLEARSPFLDHEFMEFAARIPAEMKLKGMTTKYILKKAFRNRLPDAVISRGKQGFAVPLDHWFRSRLKDMAFDILLSQRTAERGYFRQEMIIKILDEHVSGTWNWQNHIWNLLMLELWHRMFIDG
jgi:asparagine synthase (glutamine-hydrolysing)